MEKKEKSSSKTNLNESTLPLLEEVETKGEKEMKNEKTEETTFSNEKDEKNTDEKNKEEKKKSGTLRGLFDKKKMKEEKKEKKEKKVKEPNAEGKECSGKNPVVCAQNFTVGLNVIDRDEKRVNDFVNLNFEDIIAEPDANHGLEFFWRVTFLLFNFVRGWLYKLFAAIIALPLAVVWAIIFAIISVVCIWIITPLFRIYDVILHFFRRIWSGAVRSVLDPFSESGALLMSNIKAKHEANIVKATKEV